ncbi:GNAT family N-acetyltransferase [Solihabitans fulvus]|uniref:GNAT family N-acetyltransferase n=1 Tax=Solihabitans fulvus TaxID=1892852 RepID=UPI001CB7639E|nr:GNAT family N-acetyltransferase [Solihabitans fulvus]
MDPTVLLEHHCADAWPALVDQPLGQWRLRAAGGFTGRANSALATGDPGIPVPEALRLAIGFADGHGIAPLAMAVLDSVTEKEIADAGWRMSAHDPGEPGVAVLTGGLAGLRDADPAGADLTGIDPTGTHPSGAIVRGTASEGWLALAEGGEPSAAALHVLTGGTTVGFGSMAVGGETVGVVRGAIVGDLLHISRLAVRADHRRRGLARTLLAALAGWALALGASRCVLQVADPNDAAMRLYVSLGCIEHHRYRYWSPAGA